MIRSILHTLGTKFSVAIINLLIAIAISQYLGADGKGLQGLIIASMAYILIISNIVGGASIVYLSPRSRLKHILLPAYIWAIFISGLAYFALAWSSFIEKEYVPYIVFLTLISSFTAVNNSILIGHEKVKQSNLVGLIQPSFTLLFLFFFFLVQDDLSIQAYLNAFLVSLFSSFVLGVFFILKLPTRSINSSLLNVVTDLFKYGILNQLSHIFQVLSFRLGYFWLAETSSRADVGVFSNATSVIESVWIISRALSVVQYARIVNLESIKEAQQITLQFVKIVFILSIFACGILMLLPKTFYTFIFGPEFGEMSFVIRLLSPGIIFFSIYIIISHYFSGTGRYHTNALISFIGLIITVVALYVLSPLLGMMGVALSHTISYEITAILALILFYRKTDIHLKDLWINKSDLVQLKQSLNSLIKS